MATETRDDFPEIRELLQDPDLSLLVPMVYVAWSDGDLSSEEIRGIRGAAAEQDWLDKDELSILSRWLDPENPPTARQMTQLMHWLQQRSEQMDSDERVSLAELGVRIARMEHADNGEIEISETTREALGDLEEALGIVGQDACSSILRASDARPKATIEEPEPAFDLPAMTETLDGEFHETKERIRELLTTGRFEYQWELPRSEYREQVLEWTKVLADEGIGALSYPEHCGGADDLGAFVTSFEALAMFDQNLVVKFGVQFGLFGGSILFLGTEKHHEKYLERVGKLELPGGFAMSELGHGSNVRDLETVARYDRENEEFVITTPCESARKEWIGNAAAHGRMMTVFAQLEVDGENYGVHAFLVPVRDEESGEPLDGVRIEDCGHKMGLNGVDNGRLWFEQVRVPRENLLDRYGSVDDEGDYSSPIPSAGKRFFTMLGTLVGGRVSVAAASATAMKSALAIATRYGARRRQFGPAGEAEEPLLDYRSHQRRLMPRIARCYGLSFAINHLKQRYLNRTEEDQREVEALAAGLKAYASWTAVDAVQEAREACGGMGYLTENRISELRKNLDIYTTFEGDNTVLMMLVARGLLTEFQRQFSDERVLGVVRFLARQAATAVQETNPVVVRNTDRDHLRSADFQVDALKYRERDLLQSAARRIQGRIGDGMAAFDAFNDIQDHLISLAEAHVEWVVLKQFAEAVDACEDAARKEWLEKLRSLYAMDCMYEDIGWFLENGYVASEKARAIRDEINALSAELRPQAVPLVDAFGIPKECLAAPIAFNNSL